MPDSTVFVAHFLCSFGQHHAACARASSSRRVSASGVLSIRARHRRRRIARSCHAIRQASRSLASVSFCSQPTTSRRCRGELPEIRGVQEGPSGVRQCARRQMQSETRQQRYLTTLCSTEALRHTCVWHPPQQCRPEHLSGFRRSDSR